MREFVKKPVFDFLAIDGFCFYQGECGFGGHHIAEDSCCSQRFMGG